MSADLSARPVASGVTEWRLTHAALIAPDRPLVVGSFPGVADGDSLVVTTDGECDLVECHVWKHADLTVIVLDLEVGATAAIAVSPVADPSVDAALPELDPDIGDILRSGVAALPSPTRRSLLAFLVRTSAEGRDEPPATLAQNLRLARQTLRPRLTPGVIDREAARGLKIEVLAAIDDRTFYARGWIGHATPDLRSVVVDSPECGRAELAPGALPISPRRRRPLLRGGRGSPRLWVRGDVCARRPESQPARLADGGRSHRGCAGRSDGRGRDGRQPRQRAQVAGLGAGDRTVTPRCVPSRPPVSRHRSRARSPVPASHRPSRRASRSAATGPAVVQDTGHEASGLPVGEGLLTFRDVDGAASALYEVLRDPERHSRAARAVAEEHFEARQVLTDFIERCDL